MILCVLFVILSWSVFVWQIFLHCDLEAWDVQCVDRKACHYMQQQHRSNRFLFQTKHEQVLEVLDLA